jgi:oxygen-dependent protoporphyrinogen oxidase
MTNTDTRTVIIGGGIAGLATAAWLEADHGDTDVLLLEASPRPGGRIQTTEDRGFVLEHGPQGFLDKEPATLELAHWAGLADALLPATDAASDRFIARHGRLVPVPLSPPAFLTSPMLSLPGRLRTMAEFFGRRHPGGDESVFDFASRRIGREAAEILVDSMVTGVFAGDSRQLSLAATFPRMAAMEAEHGSLTRALIATMRKARSEGRKSAGPSGPGGTLTSFAHGMQQLSDGVAERLGDRVRLATPVRSIHRDHEQLVVTTDDGEIRADDVVLACDPQPAGRLLAPVVRDAAEPLGAMATVPVTVLMAAYPADAFPVPPAGFGFLVPRPEHLGILGTLFCHSIFAGHAPDGRLLLRTMVGGAREPDVAHLEDNALVDHVRAAHATLLGADPEPDHTWIVRWPEAIAQYTIGHRDRVGAAEEAARGRRIHLTGSAYRGVSVNDCIRNARELAKRLRTG